LKKQRIKNASIDGDMIDTFNAFIDLNSNKLTDKVVKTFLAKIIVANYEHMVIVASKNGLFMNKQLAPNRKSIASLIEVNDGYVQIQTGIKNDMMNYKIIVIEKSYEKGTFL
jgi:hypothetical protein